MRALTFFSLSLVAAWPFSADAQQPTSGTAPAPAGSNAVGAAFDSLRGRPLSGARVRVDTSTLVVVTDANGRFHIEGIPPGQHSLRLEHPLLDTLGVTLRSPVESYGSGETKPVGLVIPPAPSIVEMLCAPAWRARGPAALMGRVREADSGNPAVGAKVSLVWYELDVNGGIRKSPRVREASVGAEGTFRICGLPTGIDGKMQVLRGALTSGDIPVSFGQDVLVLRSMGIAAPGAVVAAPPASNDSGSTRSAPTVLGSARLTGRVLSKTGQPLAGARVQLEGTTRATATRANGEFALDSLPPGTQTLAVRLLGYAPVEAAVDLSSREPRSITVSLDNFVPMLEAVRVSAQRDRALDDVGFSRRKRMGQGWYMDPDEVKRHEGSQYFSDVLRLAPGLRITPAGNNRQIIQNARDPMGGCVNIWVDGTNWQQLEPGDVDDFVKPFELGAIEVYSSTSTPPEYQPAGRGNCSTVVAWTKRRLERRR